MNLEVEVIAEELAKIYKSQLIIGNNSGIGAINGIKYYKAGELSLNSNYIYVLSESELPEIPDNNTAVTFAIIISDKPEDATSSANIIDIYHKSDSNLLLLYTADEKHDVINSFQDIFTRYDSWYSKILQMIHSNSSLQEVFNACVSMLGIPVAMFDSESILVMKAGKIPDQNTDSVWDYVLENSRYFSGEISPILSRQVYERMMSNSGAVTYYSKAHNEFQMTAALFIHGSYYGILGTAKDVDYSEIDRFIFWQCKLLMELALENNSRADTGSLKTPYFIERMLDGYSIDTELIKYQISQFGLKHNESFQLYRIIYDDEGELFEYDFPRYLVDLKTCFPSSIIFSYENSIVVISSCKITCSESIRFEDILRGWSMHAGVSMEYSSFMLLKFAYIQSKFALILGSGTIRKYEDYYDSSILYSLNEATSLKALCHPKLLQFWQSGGDKAHEYIICLCIYLQNGRNLTETAKKMNTHRNTITYRIERLGDILELDFKSNVLDDQLISQLLMTCKILINSDF